MGQVEWAPVAAGAIGPSRQDLLRQRFEAVGRISPGFAHDLNNLLGIISNVAELQRGTNDAVQNAAYSAQIASVVARCALLTRKLSSFTRPGVPQCITLRESLGDLAHLVGYSVGPKVDVCVGVCDDTWAVRVDPLELQLALVNLAINSGHAMPDGGTLTITTANTVLSSSQSRERHVSAGEFVEIQVADNGQGMSEETLDRAFEPYFTTKSASLGSGLGLAQVQAFACAAGGGVHARSTKGTGTTVTLYLPRAVIGS